ncbi:MAG: tetratricopeptide repeat protein [Bryobacteraceae bacterium]
MKRCLLFLLLLAAYSNHFGNGFHFDDSDAVENNPAIRSLTGIPRFFTDVSTFNANPYGRSYRPLVTTSLAIDYALGHGLDPFWFQLSTFFWFIVQLVLIYALFLRVTGDEWIAWFATAVYALHPACAETVNYIVQRGDLYAALGIVAGVALYAGKPEARRYGFYLLPALAGMFAKPTALIFAPILLAYILLIERKSWLGAIPAFVLCGAFSLLEKAMTPPNFFHTTLKSYDYIITQPYVTLRYFRSFFFPLYLNVDTDLPAFHTLKDPLAILGFVFCGLLIAAAVYTAIKPEWRAVSFGLWWFLLALIPTALYPLNEVENDHRMFLPFIGLSLAAAFTASRYSRSSITAFVLLGLFAFGTYQRNAVWQTDESLWRDDIEKSPNNARGHYNLGVILSKQTGRASEAVAEFQTALRIRPDYAEAHTDLGVLLEDSFGRIPEAVSELEAAVRIDPKNPVIRTDLGNALLKLPGRELDAIHEYDTAIRLQPESEATHFNLAFGLSKLPDRRAEAVEQYETALRIQPDYGAALLNLAALFSDLQRWPESAREYEAVLRVRPDLAAAHYNLGIALSKLPGRLPDAIQHYQEAVRIDPNYTDAHTNLGVALTQIPGRIDEAVAELRVAARLSPDSPKTHSNLAIVLAQRRN